MTFKNLRHYLPISLFALTCSVASSQEGFKIGVHGGIPVGELNDQIGIVVEADMGFIWAPNKIFDLGVKAGIIHGFPETFKAETIRVKSPSMQFVPVAASMRIWAAKSFSFGGDVGHAFGLNEGKKADFTIDHK